MMISKADQRRKEDDPSPTHVNLLDLPLYISYRNNNDTKHWIHEIDSSTVQNTLRLEDFSSHLLEGKAVEISCERFTLCILLELDPVPPVPCLCLPLPSSPEPTTVECGRPQYSVNFWSFTFYFYKCIICSLWKTVRNPRPSFYFFHFFGKEMDEFTSGKLMQLPHFNKLSVSSLSATVMNYIFCVMIFSYIVCCVEFTFRRSWQQKKQSLVISLTLMMNGGIMHIVWSWMNSLIRNLLHFGDCVISVT